MTAALPSFTLPTDPEDTTPPGRDPLAWLAPTAAAVVLTGWTVIWALAHWPLPVSLAGLAGWISGWAPPALVVLVGLALARRGSMRLARRNLGLAGDLVAANQQLEAQLARVAAALAVQQARLAEQAATLDTLGDTAGQRLTTHADRLRDLASAQAHDLDRIAAASAQALDNLSAIGTRLPAIASASRDVTSTLATTGRTAQSQLDDLGAGLQRLHDFSQTSERQIESVRAVVQAATTALTDTANDLESRIDEQFAGLRATTDDFRLRLAAEQDAGEALIRARAATLSEELAAQRTALAAAAQASFSEMEARAYSLRRAIDQIAAIHESVLVDARQRLATFDRESADLLARLSEDGAAFETDLTQRRQAIADHAAEQRAVMGEHMAALDAAITHQRSRLRDETLALTANCEAIGARLATIGEALAATGHASADTMAAIDAALVRIDTQLGAARATMGATDRQLGALAEGAVRLVELLEAGETHARDALPAALANTAADVTALGHALDNLGATLREAGADARDLDTTTRATHLDLARALAEVARLHDGFATRAAHHLGEVHTLRDALAATATHGEALIADLSTAFAAMAERSGSTIAETIETQSTAAAASVDTAVTRAVTAAREHTRAVHDDLARVADLAANLEARVERAHERAREAIDNDFARRAALITESLNSAAIDITRALSEDVSEKAWGAYLRGERGVFTRRAVALLAPGEAKAIQQHYTGDPVFRENVNRYIHDFEALLRQLLSTRDGHALGVTLLSADVGKLYVALAQGIERLRQ